MTSINVKKKSWQVSKKKIKIFNLNVMQIKHCLDRAASTVFIVSAAELVMPPVQPDPAD
jgi:hypothetical protein